MDQAQRRDIRKLEDNTLSMSVDGYGGESPYSLFLVESDYKCNNWVVDGNDFSKQSLPQTDSIIFNIAPLEELALKNIVGLKINITMSVENFTSRVPTLESVGFYGDFRLIGLPLVNREDHKLELDLKNFSQSVIDSLVTEKGFDIVLNFDGDGSNCSVTLSDLELLVYFEDKLEDERDVVWNRVRDKVFDMVYPVGSIYTSVNDVNPSVLFGGVWEKIKDTFLLASGTTYSTGATGGEATHKLTVNEMPSHRHDLNRNFSDGSGGSTNAYIVTADRVTSTKYTGYTGGGQAHNNMPPYLVVNVWKRVE